MIAFYKKTQSTMEALCEGFWQVAEGLAEFDAERVAVEAWLDL